jgi:hypothetical protein
MIGLEFKNTTQIFWQKVRVKTFPKISTSTSMSVFPRLFLFYRIFGCFSAMGVQKHYKKRFAKKSLRKCFTKQSTKSPKPTFSRFCYYVFGRFSVRGVQKQDLKLSKKKSNPSPFLAFDPPTHHGGHRFFFNWRLAAPCSCPCPCPMPHAVARGLPEYRVPVAHGACYVLYRAAGTAEEEPSSKQARSKQGSCLPYWVEAAVLGGGGLL